MHNTWFGGLVSSWFDYRSLLPNTKFDFTCLSGRDAFLFVCRILPSQLSYLGSSVGKSIAWKADSCGVESHPRQSQFFFEKLLFQASCVVLLCLSVVLLLLPCLSQHLLE